LKNRIELFTEKKGKEKIALLTSYDYATSVFLEQAKIDAILVGDSLGMVFQGNPDTLPVTLDEMIYHTKAVRRGCPDTFLIFDMPYLTYHVSIEDAVKNAGRVIKETGAEAVKVEGGTEMVDVIKALLRAKIPVMGHIGLTPQSVNVFGGFKVQGKSLKDAKKILNDALALEQAGVFSIVLESIPEKLAEIITKKLKIATIGIGAGRYVDGQVLVINDIFGIYKDLTPKFAKIFADVGNEMKKGINNYISEVKNKAFPEEKNTFSIDQSVIDILNKE
jgi:3-methyl-2-oxobutanoate hydroxymethyltransferase